MILESKTDTIILEDGDVQESTNMEIDIDSHVFIMRMLSKFYSDGIGSSIRETASNALDSHRACGVTEPIIVSLIRNKDGNYEFSVQDFGCGLDDKDVENIIKKYGKSTKRQSTTQLGCFGLGFKSPLAYTSSFYFIGRKNGIERKWMLYESDDESNKIDLLYESETTERNGVKVIIPVKYSDANDFITKMRQQLAYFENVYFDCQQINNNFTITRSEDFQWSSLCTDKYLHICLDNVYYPIDFDKLGISRIDFPIGLRFSLSDGIFPVPNREQLKYTKEAKEIILKKIKKVSDYFISKYNESIKDSDNIFEILKYYQYNSRYIPHFSGVGNLDVKNLAYHSSIKFNTPKLNNVKLLDMKRVYEIKEFLLYEYKTVYAVTNGRFSAEKTSWRSKVTFDKAESGQLYLFSDLSMLKKTYLRDILPYQSSYFIRKDNKIKLGNIKYRYTGAGYDNYVTMLQLHNFPKSEWRERIKEWQYIASLVTSRFKNVDKMEIPQEWLDARKKQRVQTMIEKGTNVRRKKLEGEVTGKEAKPLERYVSGKNCKFVPVTFKMNEAHKSNKLVIYGGSEKESLFQELYKVLDKKSTQLVIFSDRELKSIKEISLHNWIEVGKFMEGKHKVFKRMITAYLISKLRKEYSSIFSRILTLKEVSISLGEKAEKLDEYVDNYFMSGNEEFYESAVKVAEENNLFDTSIYDIYKEVKTVFEKLPFLKPVFGSITYREDEGMIKALRDLFKYYKQRIDWQHYNLPVNEEKKEETVVENIEEVLV